MGSYRGKYFMWWQRHAGYFFCIYFQQCRCIIIVVYLGGIGAVFFPMNGLITDGITHGIIKSIIGFYIDAMLLFHLRCRTHYRTLLFHHAQYFIHYFIYGDGCIAFIFYSIIFFSSGSGDSKTKLSSLPAACFLFKAQPVSFHFIKGVISVIE